jgi:hypothetical protein
VTTETGRFEIDVRDVREAISLEKQEPANNASAWVKRTQGTMEMIKLVQNDLDQQRRRSSRWKL